ncbi:MAG TPA: glycosyltransferase [Bryobacteraceae bacterium]|nr:glycosyltransferase [Bryobacteraceae bacterium]
MPAIAVGQGFPAPETTADELRRPFRIAFAGTSTATIETLRILANLIADGSLSQERRVELHLYIPAGYLEDLRAEGIVFHEWLPEAELRQALSAADLLFLPYSFMGNLDHVTSRSFPAKTADYLACGKPILLMAPASAAVVRYARENGFAAIIDQPDSAALRDTILRLIQDSADRARLARNARAVFLENHDIARQRESVYHRIAELSQTRSGSRRS